MQIFQRPVQAGLFQRAKRYLNVKEMSQTFCINFTCINFSKSAFYAKWSPAFKLVHLPPSLRRLQVSRSHWHLPAPWKTTVWYNTNKRSISGEDSGAQGNRPRAMGKPKSSHNFPCKTRSLIFEEAGEARNFQRTLILFLSKLGKKRPRTPVNRFKVFLCCKNKPIPIQLLWPQQGWKREEGKWPLATEGSRTGLGLSVRLVSFMLMTPDRPTCSQDTVKSWHWAQGWGRSLLILFVI